MDIAAQNNMSYHEVSTVSQEGVSQMLNDLFEQSISFL